MISSISGLSSLMCTGAVFAAEGDAVGMSDTTSKSESEAFRLHMGCISSVERNRKASI